MSIIIGIHTSWNFQLFSYVEDMRRLEQATQSDELSQQWKDLHKELKEAQAPLQ